MMTHELEVSILAAPLAQMDRGALSQAWYSALRLARNVPEAGRSAPPRSAIQMRPAESAHVTNEPMRRNKEKAGVAWFRCRRSASELFETAQRTAAIRARRFSLAQQIERAFAGAPSRQKRATFSLGRGDARVHIILQTTGARATLLAICRPEHRMLVGHALSQARLALARRGIGLQLCALGERACS